MENLIEYLKDSPKLFDVLEIILLDEKIISFVNLPRENFEIIETKTDYSIIKKISMAMEMGTSNEQQIILPHTFGNAFKIK